MIFDIGPDKRFFGTYRGIVVDSEDPEGLRRIRLRVPQVLGEAVTDWAWPMGGNISQQFFPYATFSDITDQTQTGGVANTATPIKFEIIEDNNGIFLDADDTSKIVFTESGDYFIQFSAVFSSGTSSAKTVDVWFRKNGTDIPRSNTRMTVQGNPNEAVMAVSSIVDLEAGDVFQLFWASPEATMALTSHSGLTGPTRPDIPGIILTVNLEGRYKPSAGTPVWVTFEGGDPNFPLWIGAY